MSDIKSSRLRHVSSSDVFMLEKFINDLPFKVEIKGNPVLSNERWYVFFIIPEINNLEFASTDLD